MLPFALSSSVDVKEASNVARGAVLDAEECFDVGVVGGASLDLSRFVDNKEDDRENLDSLILSLERERSFVPLVEVLLDAEELELIDSFGAGESLFLY